MLRFLIFFLHFAYSRGQLVPTELEFDRFYANQTTIGKLIPKLYELPAVNDTRPFAVRVVLASRDVTESDKISLQMKRGQSDLQALFNDTVRVSVSSGEPILFNLMVKKIHGFDVRFQPRKIVLSPPEPSFFRFSFSKGVDQIAVRISSTDDVCGRVTILKAGCPVFDNEGQIVLYDNYKHQTITKKGCMIISKDMFGDDIHIVFTVLPIDEPCRSRDSSNALFENPFRLKNFTADIKPFEPNQGATIIAVSFIIVLVIIVFFIAMYFWNPNYNPEDAVFEGTLLFWTFCLAQVYVVLPLALVIVSLRETDSYQSSDTDTCNFNFECAIPQGGFFAFNNIISAFTILAVGIANHIVACKIGRWRRMFPLNVWISITGFFWTVMNKCPQEHTYYFYSIAMMMTVIQAKLLLFEKRNGRNINNYIFIGLITMLMMICNIFDNNVDSTKGRWILSVFAFLTELLYVIYTSFAHGLWKMISINEEYRIQQELEKHIQQSTSEQTNLEQNLEEGYIQINTPRPTNVVEIPTSPVVDDLEQNVMFQKIVYLATLFLQPGTLPSVRNETETANDITSDLATNPNENQDDRQSTTDTAPLIAETRDSKHTKALKKVFFAAAVCNIIIWTVVSALWMNSTTALLRFIQCDFAIYFMVYLANKLISPTDRLRNPIKFWLLLAASTGCIIAWGCISGFLLPAHVPVAESRALNSPCLRVLGHSIGMDWHDVLHFLTAIICFIYHFLIVVMDQELKVIEPASEII
ncbi:unnamed protein product [Caenorhabditis brenneri]